jgi:tRNA A37 N6-isopentenylltransferase MiaA
MGAIIIRADKKSNRILSELAQKLGGSVINLEDEQYEDFALGSAMDSAKTGETVDRDLIMRKLKGK